MLYFNFQIMYNLIKYGKPLFKIFHFYSPYISQYFLHPMQNKFVPRNGKSVSWYSCGPTVYDASHMGHAR